MCYSHGNAVQNHVTLLADLVQLYYDWFILMQTTQYERYFENQIMTSCFCNFLVDLQITIKMHNTLHEIF